MPKKRLGAEQIVTMLRQVRCREFSYHYHNPASQPAQARILAGHRNALVLAMHYIHFPLFRYDLLGYQPLLLRRFSPLQVIFSQMDMIRELRC